MKRIKGFNILILSEDRVIFMLSSLFCVLISLSGCGSQVAMHKVDETQKEVVVTRMEDMTLETGQQTTSELSVIDQYTEDTQPNFIKVHICGAVNEPGVYEIVEGSRVIDGIEQAGGFSEEAYRDGINLAVMLSDCSRVYVPSNEDMKSNDTSMGLYMAADAGVNTMNEPCSDVSNSGKININTAGGAELQRLPGIGETRAKAIIAYRDSHGDFAKTEDIQNVSGIGPSSYEKMKDMITVN